MLAQRLPRDLRRTGDEHHGEAILAQAEEDAAHDLLRTLAAFLRRLLQGMNRARVHVDAVCHT